MVVNHYSNNTAAGDSLDEPSPKRQSTSPKLPPGIPRALQTPRDNMQALANIEYLEIPAPYQKYIDKHGTDPIKFLDDNSILTYKVATPGFEEADLHISIINYIKHLYDRKVKDRVRLLFCILLYFNLAKLIYPKGTGRVGSKMEEDIRELI